MPISNPDHSLSESLGDMGSTRQIWNRRNCKREPKFVVDDDIELDQQVLGPITYAKTEPDGALDLNLSCFTMQTHVILFNFSWLASYYGTPKFDTLRPEERVLPFRYTVAASITHPAIDVRVLVIDAADRIIVAFHGSMRNLATSMSVLHERVSNVVPSVLDGPGEPELEPEPEPKSEPDRLRAVFGRHFRAARVHRGCAAAYTGIAVPVLRAVRALLRARARPLQLTGHSFGGALAALCALDAWAALRVPRRDLLVSTFGAPRLGNGALRRVLAAAVPGHWRLAVSRDPVPRFPAAAAGYRHAGTQVIFTPRGEMFIVPDTRHFKLPAAAAPAVGFHRKACYLLALRAWCLRQHRMSYTPCFWPFPVREDDYQRFAAADVERDWDHLPGKSLTQKFIGFEEEAEALDDGTGVDAAVVEKWGRLAARLLHNDKPGRAMTA